LNINKIKKISVRFPNFVSRDSIEYEGKKIVLKLPEIQDINNRLYSKIFSNSSNVQIGPRYLPKIEGFNCTWRNNEKNPYYTIAQFTFASCEERKVGRIIEKYGGTIIPSREDLHQWEFEEGNNKVENVNETIQ